MTPVIFDLDGTLIDSVPDIAAALNLVFTAEGLGAFDRAEVTSFIGNGLPNLVHKAMNARGLGPDDHPRLNAAVNAAYRADPTGQSRIYPGALEALEVLRAAGHPLGLCTNKAEDAALLVLEQLGLARYFDAVVGGGRLEVLKPDPAPLRLCMRELGAETAIFVGDSEVDAQTALAADLPFLLYTEGYRKSPAEDLPQTAAFSDFAQLPWLVAEQS